MVVKDDIASLQREFKVLQDTLAERDEQIASLKEDVTRYNILIHNTPDLIHSVTPDGDFIFVNEAWKKTLGYSDEEIKSLKLMEVITPGQRLKCQALFEDLLKGASVERNITTFLTSDGREVQVEGRCNTIFENGVAVAMTGIFRDVTLRLARDAALKESEERYRDLFENSTELIQLVAPDGQFLYVNRAWKKTFGYNDDDIEEGLSLFDLIAPECQDHCLETFSKVVASPEVNYIDTVFAGKDGRRVIIQGSAKCKFVKNKPVLTQCIFRDVTEQKKMEEELLKNQKIESLGILAGGIAHDFNNLLTAILGNVSLAKRNVDPGSKIFRYLNNMENASERATGLTQQLLTFSKGGEPVKTTASVADLVEESARFTLRGSNVSCEFNFNEDGCVVDVDQGQLGQVVQNLVINAAQAMPDGGQLVISCENVYLEAGVVSSLPAGQYVRLAFIDQGCGIPPENIEKIFDPYFSSKATGNGLGLAVSYSIMKNHGGAIVVQSELAAGAEFSLYLPAGHHHDISPLQSEVSEDKVTGKILVMDDEVFVRETAQDMLEYLECQVVLTANGFEAVKVYEEELRKGTPFDMVIMDLTIPGSMGGLETLGKLQGINPEVKALVSSGYANDPIMANYLDYGFVGVIPKPFNVEALTETLRQVLRP